MCQLPSRRANKAKLPGVRLEVGLLQDLRTPATFCLQNMSNMPNPSKDGSSFTMFGKSLSDLRHCIIIKVALASHVVAWSGVVTSKTFKNYQLLSPPGGHRCCFLMILVPLTVYFCWQYVSEAYPAILPNKYAEFIPWHGSLRSILHVFLCFSMLVRLHQRHVLLGGVLESLVAGCQRLVNGRTSRITPKYQNVLGILET